MTFDDAAANSITDYWVYNYNYYYYNYYFYDYYYYYNYNQNTTYTGSLRPTSALSTFVGKSGKALNGTWQLLINNSDYDNGMLSCWSLGIAATARVRYDVQGLPADLGLVLTDTGVLSGTPQYATNLTIKVTATAVASGCTGSTNYTITVNCPAITLQPITSSMAQLNVPFSSVLTATGGKAPYTFTSPPGSLPGGVSVTTLADGTGLLSGTATNTGVYTFNVTATDASGCSGTRAYTLTLVCGGGVLQPVTIVNLPVVGQAYTQIFSVANGGTGSNTYLLAAGSLPPGLTLTNAANGNAALLGKATHVGNYSFQLMVLTPGGCLVQRTYNLAVVCAASGLGPDQLPLGQLGVPYPATQLTTIGGAGSSIYTVIDGSLPAGMSVSTNGVLQGTPTSASSVFTVLATDVASAGTCAVTKSYTIIISLGAQVMVLGPDTLTEASAGQIVAQSLTASGGSGPVLFAVTAGALPDGVTLSNTGQLQGTPTVPGTNTFTISASDASGLTGSRQYRLVVRAATASNSSNDIGVSILAAAGATVGNDLTYAITVTNLGSAAASAVTVSNLLPAGATFVSASAGAVADGVLTAPLGTLAPNAGVTVTVVVNPSAAGNLDLVANVSAAEADGNPANNSADVTVPVAAAPALDTVQFAATSYVATRNGGAARITVTRTGPATATATVGYTTGDGSGQAGIDYAAGSGLLIFGAGVTEQSFTVTVLPVKGAKITDKTVALSLSSPSGARLGSVPSATLTLSSKLVVTDSDGDQVTVKLTGHGSVALALANAGRGPIQQIVLTGTDAHSQLLVTTVKKAGGNGFVDVGSIVADGSVLAINAPTVNLVGAGVTVNGCLGALTIHNLLNGAAVTASCAANQTTKITLHAKDTGATIATGGHVAYKLMK